MNAKFLKYYSRKDVQKRIVEAAKSREIAVKFESGFGKRPDILQYGNEVFDLAKRGATSFHISEERWLDPMELKPGMTRAQLDSLRIGFDLLFDIDCKFIEFSKICASLISNLLKGEGINNTHIKFAGSTGFHIGINFESLPQQIEGREVKTLFPEMMREAAEYAKSRIRENLAVSILEISEWSEIADATGKKVDELKDKDKRFNPFSVIDIDSVAISSRHMFRAPYSVNEKTGLASIPIKDPLKFDIKKAKIENVEADLGFLNKFEDGEARNFLDNVFMFFYQKKRIWEDGAKGELAPKKKFEIPKIAIKDEEKFPPCVKLILQGMKEDGRKRAVFILVNFFRNLGWTLDDIQKALLEWNEKNYEKLREGYIKSQINWYKKQDQNILPPGCDNKAYMKGIGVCKPDNFCRLISNPANYTLKKVRIGRENK